MNRASLPVALVLVAALALSPAPVLAARGAAGMNLVNNTGQAISNLYIRRTGTQGWQPLAVSPAKPGRGGRGSAGGLARCARIGRISVGLIDI
jgi:hypothetical protein